MRIGSLRAWLDRRRRHHLNTEPPPPPAGWKTGPPDFVGVGAAKAGTSWWYEQIVDHPDVVRPPNAHKELRYFNRFGQQRFEDDDVHRYHLLFPRPPGSLTGEWSPGYLTDDWVPPLLHRAAPEAKLLVLLRDPVDRLMSGLVEMASRGRSVGLTERRQAFVQGCYALHLERLLTWFPKEQVLVLQYEECAADPHTSLRRTYEFLGLDSGHVPRDLHRPVHPTLRAKGNLDDDERVRLVQAYEPELRRLSALLPSLDLARWPSASQLG